MVNKNIFTTGKVIKVADTLNEAGGRAYKFDNNHALAQLAATGCMNQTFYATAETQLQQVLELTKDVSPEFIAKTAVFSRQRGYMKDMPALLTAVLAARQSPLLKAVFEKVIDNGKMLRNFIQIIRSGVTGRRSLGTAPKRLVREWFTSRDPNTVFKQSVGNNPSLADVLRIAHPKPDSKCKEALYAWLLGKPVEDFDILTDLVKEFEQFKAHNFDGVPDVPFEMLTALNLTAEDWCAIAKNARWQWTRMNINTLQRHGVLAKPEMVDIVARKLVDREAIEKARVFPYQLMAAYLNIGAEIPQKIKNALQDALEIATMNVPKIDGKVYVLVDVSGSMSHPVTGYRPGSTTAVTCVDVAALISSVILRKNDETEVIPFSDRVKSISLNPRDSVMTNAQKIRGQLGGGTNCSAPLIALNERSAKGDLVFLVSDNMSWADTYGYANKGSTRLMDEWTRFKGRNKKAKLVCLDIVPNTSSQAYERPDILNVGGFTDNVFSIVSSFVSNELDSNHWVGEIEKIRL